MIPKPVFNAATRRSTTTSPSGVLPLVLCGLALAILAAGGWLVQWDALHLGEMAGAVLVFWPISGFLLYLVLRLAHMEPPRRRRVLAAALAFFLSSGAATTQQLQRVRLRKGFQDLAAAAPSGRPVSAPWGFWGAKRKALQVFADTINRQAATMNNLYAQLNQFDEMETKEGMALMESRNLPRHEETLRKKRLIVGEARQKFYGTATELSDSFRDIQMEISSNDQELNLILQSTLDYYENFKSSKPDLFDMLDDIIERDAELTEFLKNTGDRYRLEGDRLVFEFPEEERAFLRYAAAQQEAIQKLQNAIQGHGESVRKEMARKSLDPL